MPATYDSLATTTLSTNTNQITFSSISNAYTDLRITLANITTSGPVSINYYFNNNAGNFSFTGMSGNGTTIASYSGVNRTYGNTNYNGSYSSTIPAFVTIDVMSYTATTNKSILITSNNNQNGSGIVEAIVNLWQDTTAINRFDFYMGAGTFNAGVVATLYGIKRA